MTMPVSMLLFEYGQINKQKKYKYYIIMHIQAFENPRNND